MHYECRAMRTLSHLTILLFTSFLIAGCGSSDAGTVIDTGNTGGDSGDGDDNTLSLKTAASNAELEAQIKSSLINNYASVNNNYYIYTNDVVANLQLPTGSNSSAAIS